MGYMDADIRFTNNKFLQFIISIQKECHLIIRICSFSHSHAILAFFFLLLLLIQTSSPATAQFVAGPDMNPNTNNKSSVFVVLAIVVIMFFISAFLSLFSRHCNGGRSRTLNRINLALHTGDGDGRSRSESRGLNQEIIDTFPTFLYSNVKDLKIGKETLACAVCLNEFQDDETLRLIPNCNHVFHPSCIDVWLSSHSTCPVCRANLVPRNEDAPPVVSIHIPNEEEETISTEEDMKGDKDVESPKVNLLHRSQTMNHTRPIRSRSTGFLFNILFPRSNSTGRHSGESFERFTLRLPDEVLNSALKRTNSCVNFRRISSGRKGFRTRSVGNGRGRSYFGSEEHWGLYSLMTPFFTRNSWNRSTTISHFQCSGVVLDDIVNERSSDLLCPK